MMFQRRDESQKNNVMKLLEFLVETRSVKFLNGLTVTADKCYGSLGLLMRLGMFGIGTTMVIPEHNLICYPLVGRSSLDPSMCH